MESESDRPKAPGETGYGAAHYEALGRFIERFAHAEIAFVMAFRHYSEMPISEARLLFGRVRSEDLIQYTRRLMVLHKHEKKLIEDFDDLVRQFNAINYVRNRLIHWQFLFHGRNFRVSDIATASALERTDTIEISIDHLNQMRDDLLTIWVRIMRRHIDPNPDLDTSRPWQYKPSSPKSAESRRERRRTR